MKTRNLVSGYLFERWKYVPDYEGYYKCSSLGRVKSIFREYTRKNGIPITTNGRFMSKTISNGYASVGLRKDYKYKSFRVHQLVAMTFLGHIRNRFALVIDHIDGNKLNNHTFNLQIVTNRENTTTCFKENRGNLTSQLVGVSWNKRNAKWQSFIRLNGDPKYLGSFSIELYASNAYQKALRHIKDNTIEIYLDSIKPKFSSSYKGVTWDKRRSKWKSSIMIKRKITNLGHFTT